MSFQPSNYQQAVFDWIEQGQGNLIINAVAGSGKTSTLVEAARRIQGGGLFLAFNKHIADELKSRLEGTGMIAKTIHSIGNQMVGAKLGKGIKVIGNKYRKLADDTLINQPLGEEEEEAVTKSLRKIVDLARLTLTNPRDEDALTDLCAHFNILPHGLVFNLLPTILERGKRMAEQEKVIDYADMIWLPQEWHLTTSQVKWVMVDECQDLNAAQLEIALKCCALGGRMVFVGDRRQSIMGFSGADNESFDKIKTRTQATELPLSLCYRCPPNHIALAANIVPQIEAVPGRAEGVLAYHLDDELFKLVQEGDLVMCRTTAPLVGACIKLIENKVPARVKGKDIGSDLVELLKKVQKRFSGMFHYSNLTHHLDIYQQEQVYKLASKEGNEAKIESLIDRLSALQVCAENFDAKNIDEFAKELEELFSDDRAAVTLCTVHRTKGLEADRIIIIHPEKLPMTWLNQQAWEYEQETNLTYVALTRAKKELHIVHAKDFDASKSTFFGIGGSTPQVESVPSVVEEPTPIIELPEPVLEATPPEPEEQSKPQEEQPTQLGFPVEVIPPTRYEQEMLVVQLGYLLAQIRSDHGGTARVKVTIELVAAQQ